MRVEFTVLALAIPGGTVAQQVADTAFAPPIGDPKFAPGTGPTVCIDQAHQNFRTATGRYLTFARLMERAGFRVRPCDRSDENTTRQDVTGSSQGRLLEVGAGRLAVFGEAAMFSAQRAGPERRPLGMNAPAAGQNAWFLRNVMPWLGRANG